MKSKNLLRLMAKQKRVDQQANQKSISKATDRVVYSEFGTTSTAATERAVPDLPPDKQDLRVQISRKGRKGKSVTIISGFAHKIETLEALAKKLKAQCGSGGTVKDNTIEIQGEHATKLVSLLVKQGYKAKISGG
ncbi:MAG: translation initiation factor [Phormidesmis sp.]